MGVLYIRFYIYIYVYAYIDVRSICPPICPPIYLYTVYIISVHLYPETYRIPETFPIAAMTAWDIVPEEKPGFCRSQGLRCSKYGVPNGMGMYMCRFIKCSMTTP